MTFKWLQWLTVACWLGFSMPSKAFNNNYIVSSSMLQRKLTEKILLPYTSSPALLAESTTCPLDVESLMSSMLRDLPNYGNRVIQRSRSLNNDIEPNLYIIVAGRAEFQPLTLGPGSYNSVTTGNLEPPQQVFFTTLERQYTQAGAIETQSFHWLFLTYTESGWRLAMMFTRLGSTSTERPPTPPRESSDSIIGEAVRLWLRDCRAGAIRVSPQ